MASPIEIGPEGAECWRLRAELSSIGLQARTAEAFLAQATSRLRELLQASQVVFWAADADGTGFTPTHPAPPTPVLPLAMSLLRELGAARAPRTVAVPGPAGTLRTCLVGAVWCDQTLAGLLQVVPPAPGFEPALAWQLEVALGLVAMGLKHAERLERLRWEAGHDPLTTLPNRRGWEAMLGREMRLAERHGVPLTVLVLDVDHFKQFNDHHGHAAGDALLKAIARQLRSAGRTTDFVARYGGEEFVVLLPHTDREGGLRAATKLLEAVRGVSALPEGRGEPVSASIGLATWPADTASATELLPDADRAMYRAKRAGRDRVVQAQARASRGPEP
ncbi:MAG: GGDEF domain-containing protein [Candidatus Sericytochromatia bacterium]|nr:GGDEF domain-containing protein [Candidatus Sericytochromatia bacterium]